MAQSRPIAGYYSRRKEKYEIIGNEKAAVDYSDLQRRGLHFASPTETTRCRLQNFEPGSSGYVRSRTSGDGGTRDDSGCSRAALDGYLNQLGGPGLSSAYAKHNDASSTAGKDSHDPGCGGKLGSARHSHQR